MSLPPKTFNAPPDVTEAVDADVLPESVEDNRRCCLAAGEYMGEEGDVDKGDPEGTFLCCFSCGEFVQVKLLLFVNAVFPVDFLDVYSPRVSPNSL